MEIIKPIKIASRKTSPNEKLTAAEMGKLWATYMGNSMSTRILTYYLQHVDDEEIKRLLKNALNLSQDFLKTITGIFNKEGFPLPIGFTEEDVNLGAPRLFEDEFYVHYLKYVVKAGLSIYNVAIPLVFREDIKEFFIDCLNKTIVLVEEIKEILMGKGFIIKPPPIPIPEKPEFAKSNFLNGYLGEIRPLQALEITHLYDNIENNATSFALITGFSQVVKDEKIQKLFLKGKDITNKAVERYSQKLHDANLPSPSLLNHLITTSTFSPFSDKIMLFHKVDMFSMKIRAFGNSMAVNGRHDIALMYSKSLMDISLFVSEGATILIEKGWMEKPPEAVDRETLALKS
ncbi:MAG: DUF3231 family protein [Bacillota bacterium]|nr:DUF3231 family protein [Bacillota bacterium]